MLYLDELYSHRTMVCTCTGVYYEVAPNHVTHTSPETKIHRPLRHTSQADILSRYSWFVRDKT